jgi:periplasmic divalent cation tolerance protein
MTAKSATGAEPAEALRLVYTTLPDMGTAELFARALVEGRHAACVNLYPGMTSIYVWNGATEQASEVGVLMKTVESRLSALLDAARARHPYDVPALIVIDPADANADYLAWAIAQTGTNADG